jgi:hypothetical protein
VTGTRALGAFAAALLAVPLALAAAAATPQATPTPKPSPRPSPKASGTPRVFTNEDLEAGREKPSAVQDLRATGGEPYVPTEPLQDVVAPSPTETPEPDPRAQRLAELEAEIKSLDESAKALLWQYLQSGDTNEILRLKAEQEAILARLEEAKKQLAQLKGEYVPAATPESPATPPPG